MRNKIFYLGISIIFFLFWGCNFQNSTIENNQEQESRSIDINNGVHSDISKLIEINIKTKTSGQAHHPSITIRADSGYLIIGGGAIANYNGYGQLLYESYPTDDTFTQWTVSSKDHLKSDVASITGYAIQMRIVGLTPSELRHYLQINEKTSTLAAHPNVAAYFSESNRILIGGGFKVNFRNGEGNMIVDSYPLNDTSWVVQSKDHLKSNEAYITSYAISISNHIPGIGDLEKRIDIEDTSLSRGPTEQKTVLESTYVIVGGGANVTGYDYGNMLYKSHPSLECDSWTAGEKDHIKGSNAIMTVYAIGLRVQ